jgi:hypothetical protein
MRRAGTWPAIGGLALVLLGIVSYFVIVLHFGAWLPGVRNSALPNWALIAVGLAFAFVAIRRGGRLAWALAAVDVLVAGAFAWMMYVAWAVPIVGGPAVGVAAPDFALAAQDGKLVRLADFRGAPLLLVFYRGHW